MTAWVVTDKGVFVKETSRRNKEYAIDDVLEALPIGAYEVLAVGAAKMLPEYIGKVIELERRTA